MIARNKRDAGAGGARVRYAVVGLGHIAQVAVLPAFDHASENSELAALVSGDRVKRARLGRKYGVERTYGYDEYDRCLSSGIDAVYLALPNDLHREYAERAAAAGIHVLVEKPMALTEEDCESMIRTAEAHDVKLMVAYRLHFEEGNLAAVEMARSGRLGETRAFTSTFTMQVEEGNIRLQAARGGGPLWDIGIYCINAARSLFGAEPVEAVAIAENNGETRFAEVDEAVSATLRFPGARLASFICSFGAADVAEYRLVGTRGSLCVEPAYEYAEAIEHRVVIGDRETPRTFSKRDQFAPELVYFSDCILKDLDPEPSGMEGLADVRVIRALLQSIEQRQPVELAPFARWRGPTLDQSIRKPPLVRKPRMVRAKSPHPDE